MAWVLARAGRAPRPGRPLLAAGTGYFALAMVWIVDPFFVEPEIYGWMAPFALVLTALGGALFWALPGWAVGRAFAPGARRVAALALALALSDWVRGWLFTGLPWALFGHVWIDTPVAQLAAWGGSILLSALTLGLAALLALAATRRRRALAGLAAGVLAAGWGAGVLRLAAPEPVATGITLRLVQPNAEQALKWHPDWVWVFYQRLLDETAAPGARPAAVVWPETSVPFLLEQAGPALDQIAGAAGGAPVLMGIQRGEGAAYFNSLIEIAPDARVAQVYDKFHLVPFGEYLPWGDALARIGIGAFAAQSGFGYTAGPGPKVMRVAGLPPFQPLLCYEAVFSRHLRAVGTRPGWLLQATNDAWFGTWSGPYQHLAQARLRAIESGLPLMRAANTGITAAIDARGRVVASLGLGQIGHLDAALPPALPPTLWWRWGDGPVVGLLLVGLVLLKMRRKARLTATHG